ncbi:MAG: SMC-Scp complex subunit ScpB [Chlamydiia bacterium]|nr:SMC-Scp complex subunit ScpB [Chlamydiia bacterium]
MAKELNLFEEEIEVISEEVKSDEDLVCMLDRLKEKAQAQHEQDANWPKTKRVIEALLFASNEPIPLRKIREVTDQIHMYKPRHLLLMLDELKEEYIAHGHAFRLEEIAQGYVVRTDPEYGQYVNLLYRNKRLEKLSPASTEVLAIIAYRQPLTRSQVEKIRGVDCTGIMLSLQERGLIEVVGRLEAPGRPSLFAVTPAFLKYFGLKSLDELPKRSELATKK